MHRFIAEGVPEPGEEVALSADESHHLAKVLRIREGETVVALDGRGRVAEAVVMGVSPKGSRLRIRKLLPALPRPRVHVAFGLSKPPALEFILRRCTEVGTASFRPLLTEHSQRFSSWNESRWEKILREVIKQCESAFFPPLGAPVPLKDWLKQRDSARLLLFCDEGARDASAPLAGASGELEILIGAEGGWSREEAALVRESGAVSLGLGAHRLRAETAALVALTLVKRGIGEL